MDCWTMTSHECTILNYNYLINDTLLSTESYTLGKYT